MRRKHVNEYLRSESGRIAGTGMSEDDYGDESFLKAKGVNYNPDPKFYHNPNYEHGEVKVYKAKEAISGNDKRRNPSLLSADERLPRQKNKDPRSVERLHKRKNQ